MTGLMVVHALPLLAAGTTAANSTANNQPGGQGQEFGSSSPVALVVLILFFIAVAFLVRSMTRHLKRVPASFDPAETAARDGSGDGPDRGCDDGPGGPTDTDPAADRADGDRTDERATASRPDPGAR